LLVSVAMWLIWCEGLVELELWGFGRVGGAAWRIIVWVLAFRFDLLGIFLVIVLKEYFLFVLVFLRSCNFILVLPKKAYLVVSCFDKFESVKIFSVSA